MPSTYLFWSLLMFTVVVNAYGHRCPQKWSYYHAGENEYCMRVFKSSQAILREQADDQCKHHVSHLVSLHSTKEENYMRALMAFESSSMKDLTFWIGLRCQHNTSYWPESKQMLPIDLQIRIMSCIFSWSDKSGSGNYRNWVQNIQNHEKLDKRECAAYSELDDGWLRADCGSERHRGYVCKMKLGERREQDTGTTQSQKQETSDMPTTHSPTSSTSSNPKGTKIMLIGGYGKGSPETMETYVPDHSEQSVVSDAKLAIPAFCLVAGYLDGNIVAAGGAEGVSKYKQTQMFNSSLNNWEVMDGVNMLWHHYCPAYTTHNDMLYVFGGMGSDHSSPIDKAERLNWKLKRCEPLKPMAVPRGHPAATVHKNEIYIAGGWYPSSASKASVYKYDPVNDVYTNLQPMNTARWGFQLASFNNLIYACGGRGNVGSCEGYKAEENRWSVAPSYLKPHYGGMMLAVGGELVTLGGNGLLVEELDQQANKWVAKPNLKFVRDLGAAIVV